MVPSGWEIQNLEKIAAITSGGTPSRKKPEYWDGDIPWITTAEVQFCTITDSTEKITLNGLENSSAKLFEPGTLLIAMYGQGKTRGQVAKLGITACTNQACAAIILEKNNDSEFYFQYLSNQYETLRNLSNDGSQKNLSSGIIKSFPVHVPPLTEQIKIAKILSTWDKAIETTEKLISNSQAQKRALMQQLLTGKKRLLDVNGERFSGRWEKVKIKTIFTLKTETDSSNSYPIYSVTKNGLMNQQDYFKKEVASSDTSKYKIVHPNEFVMSGLNFWMGSVDIHLEDYPVIVSPAYKTYYINKNYNILFLKNFIKSNQFLKVLIGSSVTGASIVRRNFNTETFENWFLPMPKLKEQEKIAKVLSGAYCEIEFLEKKLEYLKLEKKALMQQLLTGKRRVKVDN